MHNLASAKRALTPGTVVEVSEHLHPELNGRRTVVKAQTKRLALSLPADHPRAAETDASWFDWPKASDLTFEDGAITITSHGHKLMVLRLAAADDKQENA